MSPYDNTSVHRAPPMDHQDDSEAESVETIQDTRTSTNIRRHDKEILDNEEEVEKLLVGTQKPVGIRGLFRRNEEQGTEVRISNRERRQLKKEARRDGRRKKRRRKKRGEESELMYEMEEGGHRDSGESSGNSSDVDRQKLEEIHSTHHKPRSRFGRLAGIHVLIIAAFVALLYGAYAASRPRSLTTGVYTPHLMSNGTSIFPPTTILISLDGFRADFLYRGITPNLNALVQAGVSPTYMLPSFPSVTFPNHFTLVTGLYPESHGIVGNTFWDPTLQEEFYYTDPLHSMQSIWWGGEPIWETAESQGVITAIHMWPGSEAHIGDFEPTYVDRFDGDELLERKVDRILGLLDLPGLTEPDGSDSGSQRPQLIAAYVPDVDADGHLHGPNSTEIRTTITRADTMVGDILKGLEDRGLSDIVNVVVVSDHGMATTSTSRLIQLDDIIDMSLIEHTDGWPLYGLRPKDNADLDTLYAKLKVEAEQSGNFEVYLRDSDMPERYHFSKNERIAPLWMIPKTGWAIVTKADFDVEAGKANDLVYHPRGLHGYDHEHPLMRAIFVAKGPAFPHVPGSRLQNFQNTEVYNIVCDSLGIKPQPNNGTFRLPLIPIGMHESNPQGETPDDPVANNDILGFAGAPGKDDLSSSFSSSSTTAAATIAIELPASVNVAVTTQSLTAQSTNTHTSTAAQFALPTRPVVHDGEDENADGKDKNLWWEWIKGNLDGVKDWATGLFNKSKGNENSEDR